MLFDSHCHLNFQAFDGRVDEVINDAQSAGVNQIVIPGTDIPTSEKAVAIAEKHSGIYAAVGIHPHHVFELYKNVDPVGDPSLSATHIFELKKLLSNPKVVAIGEVGLDRHYYEKTKHKDYRIDEEFLELQKFFLIEQIKLAYKYKKSLILHNREAKKDILDLLTTHNNLLTKYKSVFHCCEPSKKLLKFAVDHKMFIGVDGDITYYKEKQEFIKSVPLEMLVLETDSPYLSPMRRFPNEPKNLPGIAEFIARLKGITVKYLTVITSNNSRILFGT